MNTKETVEKITKVFFDFLSEGGVMSNGYGLKSAVKLTFTKRFTPKNTIMAFGNFLNLTGNQYMTRWAKFTRDLKDCIPEEDKRTYCIYTQYFENGCQDFNINVVQTEKFRLNVYREIKTRE